MTAVLIQRVTRALAGALALSSLAGPATNAAPVTFKIDSARSVYHFVNIASDPTPPPGTQQSTILDVPVIPQVTGADYDSLSGSITADEADGVLTFDGSSAIATNQSPKGPFLPNDFPGTDSFGLITNAATPVGVISAVVRDWEFTILSGTATDGTLPSDGSLTLSTTAGYQVNSFSGQVSLVGQSGLDAATTPITLQIVSGIETFALPVIRLPISGTPGQLYLYGTIVGTRQVGIPGNANDDNVVNGLDISDVASHWLKTGTPISGDVNGDGVVNGLDIALIASHWLQTGAGSSAAAAVPEPGTLTLAITGFAIFAAGVKRRIAARRKPASVRIR